MSGHPGLTQQRRSHGQDALHPARQHGVLESGVVFLPKPYSQATLVRKVREVIDAI
jgi:hypothetical protein